MTERGSGLRMVVEGEAGAGVSKGRKTTQTCLIR
jgi:hypothetical protein